MKHNRQAIRSLQDLKAALDDIGRHRPVARKRTAHNDLSERIELDEYKTDLERFLFEAGALNTNRNE